MITNIRVFIGEEFNPHYNLAVEQYLMESSEEGSCTLFLWQNQNTVVIGRNQNPWKECRTGLLEEEGGLLARRLSGGGAVFHDLGNLNFTFLVNKNDFDLDRQFGVIVEACHMLGIDAERTGRNDVTAEGGKFSGNAFYSHEGKSYHHGTILVNVDKEKLGRYLNPAASKLKAKGVDSVKARIINLAELREGLTIQEMKEAMTEAFAKIYGLPCPQVSKEVLDDAKVREYFDRNSSWQWNYGRPLPFAFAMDERFSWGDLGMEFEVNEGIVQEARVYTDSMDWAFAGVIGEAMTGKRFTKDQLTAAVKSCGIEEEKDVIAFIEKMEI